MRMSIAFFISRTYSESPGVLKLAQMVENDALRRITSSVTVSLFLMLKECPNEIATHGYTVHTSPKLAPASHQLSKGLSASSGVDEAVPKGAGSHDDRVDTP